MQFHRPFETRQLEASSRAKNRGVWVYVVEDGQCYFTHSQSQDGVIYHITRERAGWLCECPGFTYTGCCKHIAQVERRSCRCWAR
jgi:hypothetical protein